MSLMSVDETGYKGHIEREEEEVRNSERETKTLQKIIQEVFRMNVEILREIICL